MSAGVSLVPGVVGVGPAKGAMGIIVAVMIGAEGMVNWMKSAVPTLGSGVAFDMEGDTSIAGAVSLIAERGSCDVVSIMGVPATLATHKTMASTQRLRLARLRQSSAALLPISSRSCAQETAQTPMRPEE